MRFDEPVHDAHADVPVELFSFGTGFMVVNFGRFNLSGELLKYTVDFLFYLEQDKDIIMLWVPMPEDIFDTPLSEQAVNLTLGVKSFQLCCFVWQVRVITVNLQDLNTSKNSVISGKKKKGEDKIQYKGAGAVAPPKGCATYNGKKLLVLFLTIFKKRK